MIIHHYLADNSFWEQCEVISTAPTNWQIVMRDWNLFVKGRSSQESKEFSTGKILKKAKNSQESRKLSIWEWFSLFSNHRSPQTFFSSTTQSPSLSLWREFTWSCFGNGALHMMTHLYLSSWRWERSEEENEKARHKSTDVIEPAVALGKDRQFRHLCMFKTICAAKNRCD